MAPDGPPARGAAPHARPIPRDAGREAADLATARAEPEDPVERLALSCLKHGRRASDEGKLEDALAWFDRALTLQADLGIAQFCRAMVLADLGRADEAYVALEASLGRTADDAAARVQFARLCARHGHYDQALRILGPAVAAKPHLAAKLADDRDFAALRDHPYFLQVLGAI